MQDPAKATADATAGAEPAGIGPRAVLDLRVDEVRQLFNTLDPAPFLERDLDPDAERYIVDWARELRGSPPLALAIHVASRAPGDTDETTVESAIHDHFARSATATRLQLKRLFRIGRLALAVGLLFVALAIAIGELVADLLGGGRYGRLIEESVFIGAWVALWRPIEIFLYDWWPIRAEIGVYDRLSTMSVHMHLTSVRAGDPR